MSRSETLLQANIRRNVKSPSPTHQVEDSCLYESELSPCLESVSNLSGSPVKDGFVMDPMLEAALDFDDDTDEAHENGD